MRLINPDAFMRRLREACKDKATRMIVDKICVFVEVEATFHPVEAEPVRHGKWEEVRDIHGWLDRCSVCGETVRYDIEKYSRCPSCGARMEIELDKEEI